MRIQNVAANTFKSKLPPESTYRQRALTNDYWTEFAMNCSKEGLQDRLDNVLNKISNNGDNNILALESNPQKDEFYFRLYNDYKKLLRDRVELYKGASCVSNEIILKKAFTKEGGVLEISAAYMFKYKYRKLTEVILYTLERIANKGTQENKLLFSSDKKNINYPYNIRRSLAGREPQVKDKFLYIMERKNIAGYLHKFRAKV